MPSVWLGCQVDAKWQIKVKLAFKQKKWRVLDKILSEKCRPVTLKTVTINLIYLSDFCSSVLTIGDLFCCPSHFLRSGIAITIESEKKMIANHFAITLLLTGMPVIARIFFCMIQQFVWPSFKEAICHISRFVPEKGCTKSLFCHCQWQAHCIPYCEGSRIWSPIWSPSWWSKKW